jgi:hypothetical protein
MNQFSHSTKAIAESTRGAGFHRMPRKCCAVSQTQQGKLNRTPARWWLSLSRAGNALLKPWPRVCVAMFNHISCQPEQLVFSQ